MTEQFQQENPPADPDLSGQMLADFLLLRRLGRGGMADVYLAEQQSLKRQVAVKVLQHRYADNQSYIRRFHNEAKAAAALVQPNIVQIFEVGKQDDVHYIAQEYIRGQNLKQFLLRNGALDPLLAVSIMRQVASALQKAGEAGIVHRDIKPENVMISSNGEVKVADFGLARLTGDPKATDLTQVGITMGTPLYMSPEQIEGAPVDTRSDIYSLGITCYQMLTGRPPYDAETALAVAVQHLKQEPVPLEQIRPDLPVEICSIVRRMMQKAPQDRYASGADLLKDLLKIRLDQSESNWSAAFEKLSLSEAQALYSKSRLDATRKLDQVLHRSSAGRRWKWPALIIAAGTIAFLTGWLIPRWMGPPELLALAQPVMKVAEKENVIQQYHHAYFVNNAEAWLAVLKYFPPVGEQSRTNRYYGNLARVRLAGFYLDEGDLDQAATYYGELSHLEQNADENFRRTGLAGLLIIASRKGDDAFVRQNIQQVLEHTESLDRLLRDEVRSIERQLLESRQKPESVLTPSES